MWVSISLSKIKIEWAVPFSQFYVFSLKLGLLREKRTYRFLSARNEAQS